MDWKKIGKTFLFPHIAIVMILLPVATVFLVYAMIFMGTDSIIAILSYVLAFYTLVIWTLKVPYLIRFFKDFKEENKYARRWQYEYFNMKNNAWMYWRCDFYIYYHNGDLYDCTEK